MIRHSQHAPGYPEHRFVIYVSHAIFPLSSRCGTHPLAALITGADCSSPPAMAPPWPGPPQLAPEHVTKFAALLGARSALPFPL